MFFVFTALHGVILSFLVAFNKKMGHRRANGILGLALLLFSACLAEYGLYTTGLHLDFPHIIASTNILLFLVPALLLYYVKERLGLGLNKGDLGWMAPAFAYALCALPFYLSSAGEKLLAVTSESNAYIIFNDLWVLYYSVTCALLGWRSYRYIVAQGQNAAHHTKKYRLRWLKAIVLSYLAVSLLSSILYLVSQYFPSQKIYIQYSTTILHAIIVHLLGYLSIINPRMLFERKPGKYLKSGQSDSHLEKNLKKLMAHMHDNKPYLNPNLRLSQLAEEIDMGTHALSQVLNQRLKKRFNDFVNEFRIQEVKDRLERSESNHYTIMAIAEGCGFKNKNTFNRAFKYHTGMTPKEYKLEKLGQ